MTGSPAYDIREERAIRTKIDPLRTIAAIRHGFRICVKCGYEPEKTTLQQIIWALFVEAARTERAMDSPRGKGFGNGWPDVWRSPAEEFAARASRLESGLPEYEVSHQHARPTAAQVSRYDEVTVWLRFTHAVDKIQARDVLWGRAMGKPWPKLQTETGLTIKRMKNMKAEQLGVISKRLKAELSADEIRAALDIATA